MNRRSTYEIFKQMGDEVQLNELRPNESYMWIDEFCYMLITIVSASSEIIVTSVDVCSDGSSDNGWKWIICSGVDYGRFYKATEDQIQLLNSYKTESK